ncbi:ABC transporter ATP-binding protein [Actinoallomurus sp. NBC_01490]|uniref:ABC transporter ATP-binding protein n=1 Tax=Actinoallomurus sp. NBC_01490 TaxID=2903557 RepID=UPI002E2FF115|nr:ABC transporter ATP-binding protein [Actinoallomurus sp. NBC_01490]
MTLLEARHIEKSFGRTHALRGVSVAIRSGEVVAITGPSGSGKSTLLHCLSGIMCPETGEVHYDGRRIDTLDEAARTRLRREAFGIVFQFGRLVPELTAAENVALPLLFNGDGREKSAAVARAWLEQMDSLDVADARPGELSGGQLQRVAVARALVTGPKVVFADEPTGALDSVAGEKVLGLLLAAARVNGSTVVIVTHDNQVAAHADREIVVRDGAAAGVVA